MLFLCIPLTYTPNPALPCTPGWLSKAPESHGSCAWTPSLRGGRRPGWHKPGGVTAAMPAVQPVSRHAASLQLARGQSCDRQTQGACLSSYTNSSAKISERRNLRFSGCGETCNKQPPEPSPCQWDWFPSTQGKPRGIFYFSRNSIHEYQCSSVNFPLTFQIQSVLIYNCVCFTVDQTLGVSRS